MKNSFANFFAGVLTGSTALSTAAGNWPAWRGPDGTGVSSDKNLPIKCGAKENVRWRVKLPGPGSRNNSWSSMLLADGKVHAPNQSGDVFVLRAGPKFEVLATNAVGKPINASLAVSSGELFMRTDKSLWRFANAK